METWSWTSFTETEKFDHEDWIDSITQQEALQDAF